MKPLPLNTLRELFLEYFEKKGHLRLKSASLIPQGDNTLLLINAGMAPLKKYFTGEIAPPSKRAVSCQKCVRVIDIENVGKTSRHGTFFEMLGNFSFGDYFKEEAIPWAWEFLTEVLEIPEELLYPSVYTEDDEAYDIWIKTSVPAERIVRLGKEDNFWELETGPCGPCSEIYFDRGEENGCGSADCAPGCDCDRFIEVWNVVFTQFEKDGNGEYSRLANPNIDTGMGLERLSVVMQGAGSLFEVDTIRTIMAEAEKLASVKYTGGAEPSDISLRIITDHIRSAAFLIADGVIPSNEGRGYVLRRILRRAARHGRLLGINGIFLYKLVGAVLAASGDAYPELVEKRGYIEKTVSVEEERFNAALDAGLNILDGMLEKLSGDGAHQLSGEQAFKLYDTFGFPLDLTRDITEERGIGIDEKRFAELMEEQRVRARGARGGGGAASDFEIPEALDKSIKTVFAGYENFECECEIKQIISDGEAVSEAESGKAVLITDVTVFYAEGGGQIADAGEITRNGAVFAVSDVRKTPEGQYLHFGTVVKGVLSVGKARAAVDIQRRWDIMRNHSSLHLLQAALRKVLGDHVEQAGSFVSDKLGRFDFTHFSAMDGAQLAEVEKTVNDEILKSEKVITAEMPAAQAKKEGATALFGEKYGDIVRVVKIGDFSSELCGGTHVGNTSQLGIFKIISEASVASGVRRIEAVTGRNTYTRINEYEDILSNLTVQLKANTLGDIRIKTEGLRDELKNTKKNLENANLSLALANIAGMLEGAKEIEGIKLLTARLDELPADALRTAGDRVLDKNPAAVCVFASVNGEKAVFSACCGKSALAKGAHAGNILKEISPIADGGGGGRPDSAASGGRDNSKITEALNAVEGALIKQLKKG